MTTNDIIGKLVNNIESIYDADSSRSVQDADAIAALVNLLNIGQVQSVYSGLDGACCCGCAGKYTYAEHHRDAASNDRGYPVTSDEVNDRVVRMHVKTIKANARMAVIGDNHIAVTVGQRLYIAYIAEGN